MSDLTACPRRQGLTSWRSVATSQFVFENSSLTTTCSSELIVLETYYMCFTQSAHFTVRKHKDFINWWLSKATLSKSILPNYLLHKVKLSVVIQF
jgi:hypothetical protein